jgi:hypothetical protein
MTTGEDDPRLDHAPAFFTPRPTGHFAKSQSFALRRIFTLTAAGRATMYRVLN